MEDSYLIVGLGNPGREYERTRHNAGFMVVDELARQWRAAWVTERKFSSRLSRCERDGRKVLLCEPQTFMNASGEAIGALVNYHKVSVGQILVVVDDADLPFGQIR